MGGRVDEDEIEDRVNSLRKKLEDERKEEKVNARGLKPHQVHELAAAKLGMIWQQPASEAVCALLTRETNSRERAAEERVGDFGRL
jgi:hypothetical protein